MLHAPLASRRSTEPVYLTRNEAQIFGYLREEIKTRKASAERRAGLFRKFADGCDEVRGVRE